MSQIGRQKKVSLDQKERAADVKSSQPYRRDPLPTAKGHGVIGGYRVAAGFLGRKPLAVIACSITGRSWVGD
jgi:hypothetical protein